MTSNIVLYGDDFDTVARHLPKVDLIYTDPPYPREQAIPCFRALAFWGPQLLSDRGSLVTLVPHYLLEEVMNFFNGHFAERLKFRWIYCMNQENGPHPRMAMGIEILWKPMLHYVKRAYPQGRGFLRDMVKIPEPQKGMHPWQQSEAWSDYYVPKLTQPGDTVLDPYMGTGTVGVSAVRHGRNFIGVDSNPDLINEAHDRICQELSTTTAAPGASIVIHGQPGQNESEESMSAAT